MNLYDAENSFNRKFIAVKDFHGKTFHVDFDAARKLEYVQRQVHFNPDKFKDFIGEVKEKSFDGEEGRIDSIEIIPDIDLYKQHIASRTFDKIEPTAKIIKTVINCANETQLKSIKTKHLKAVTALADYFQMPREANHFMALQLEECAYEDSEIHDYMLQYGGISIASLGKYTVDSREELQNDQELLYSLDLSNLQDKGLQTLYGLHLIKDKTLITTLNIANNEIIRLDVRAILEILPEIREIDARNNKKLKILILPKNLPDHFKLYFDSNPVEYISPFKAGQRGILSFSEHCLSKQAIEVLEQAIEPNFYEKRTHYPFFAKRIFLAAGLGFALGGFIGLGTFSSKNQTQNPNVSFIAESLIRVSCYCVLKGLQLRGIGGDKEIEKDLAAAEFFAKWCAITGTVLVPIALRWLPNGLNLQLPASMQNYVPSYFHNFTVNYYGGYPVFHPTEIIYREEH